MAKVAHQISVRRYEYNGETCQEDVSHPEPVAIVDFLNILRGPICNRFDAKYNTIEELVNGIKKIACELREIRDFSKIYLVTKFFKFLDMSYSEILQLIMWSFIDSVPEWEGKTVFIIAGQLDAQDREADDRALFVLHDEFLKNNIDSVILSNDNFDSIKSHYMRRVPICFYCMQQMGETWDDCIISDPFRETFQPTIDSCCKKYKIMHPNSGHEDIIVISS